MSYFSKRSFICQLSIFTKLANVSFQIVPKQKGAMNTQSRKHDIYSSQAHQYSASVPGGYMPCLQEVYQ